MKISVCAFFGAKGTKTDGAVTKANNVLEYLKIKFGKNVKKKSFPSWKRHFISNFLKLFFAFCISDVIVILPNDKRLEIFCRLYRLFFWIRKPSIIYLVVGGWLPEFLKHNSNVSNSCRHFDGIFVETKAMERNISLLGFDNVFYSPVFSMRQQLGFCSVRPFSIKKNLNFCTFSRVTEDKGILLAIDAIRMANERIGKKCCELFIYGKMYSDGPLIQQRIAENKKFVEYKGILPDEAVLETLSQSDVMLFLTFFPLEGFPATVLEGQMVGLPVIASNWRYNSEIICDGYNGFVVEAKSAIAACEKILFFYNNQSSLYQMKKNSYDNSMLFTAEKSMEKVISIIEKRIKK